MKAFRMHVHKAGQRQLLKSPNLALSESATANSETKTQIFATSSSPTTEAQMFEGSFVTHIIINLKPTVIPSGVATHKILVYKNEAANTITSSTPIADWENNAGTFPQPLPTQLIRKYKLKHHAWTYPNAGIPPPKLKLKIRIPPRLQRFDKNDNIVIAIVSDTINTQASFTADCFAVAYKN